MSTVEIRVARRQYTCGECGKTIHRGQEYLQVGRGRYCCMPTWPAEEEGDE